MKIKHRFWRMLKHEHKWFFREDDGHGMNKSKRYCKRCGIEQWLFYKIFGSERSVWRDCPNEAFKEFKNYKFL